MSCTHDCGCTPETRDARTDEWVQIVPESARPATLTVEQPVKAPVEGENSQRPSEPVLPRRIEPEDVRVGMIVERRKGEAAYRDRVQPLGDGGFIDGEPDRPYVWMPVHANRGWSLWLIEDAPAPVDPDAAAVEALRVAHRRSPECSTDTVFAEATLDHLRAQGFDVTPRAEQ